MVQARLITLLTGSIPATATSFKDATPATRKQAGTNIEAIMQPLPVKPSKETVRRYIDRRVLEDEPPPSVEEIRRQMGWDLSGMGRNTRDERDE